MAKTGPKPIPTNLKLIRGNPGKRRIDPSAEPQFEREIPDAPKILSPDARQEWDRVVERLNAQGLVTAVDRAALAAYCQAYGRWIEAERSLRRFADRDPITAGLVTKTSNGNIVQNPLVGAANRALEIMLKCAAEFGMTPSARTRVAMAKSDLDTQDPWAHL